MRGWKKSRPFRYRRERPAAGVTAAAMSRTKLEVADIFRGHGPAWRQANASHVSPEQFKVMSAIENCRTIFPLFQGDPHLPLLP